LGRYYVQGGWVYGVQFTDSTHGWVVGQTALITVTVDPFGGTSMNITNRSATTWSTTDGGVTWNMVKLAPAYYLYDVQFISIRKVGPSGKWYSMEDN